MAKVTTSHGGQVEHQAQMCARANGRDANHPDDLQRGTRTSTRGKQTCQDGTLRSQIFIPRKNVRRKFGPLYPIAYKVMENFLGGL